MSDRFKSVDREQAYRYTNIAHDWFDKYGKQHFADARFVSTTAIAEFLANQDGLTMFEIRSDK